MTKISQLVDIGANLAANDEFIIRDLSEAGTPNKKVTASGFVDYIIAQGTGAGFTQIAAGVGPLSRASASSSGATGTLTFSTAAATTLIERARIDSSGRFLVGTSTANTSGAKLQTSDGLTFPATQVASADPNTLDDYEEGTWTVSMFDAATAGNTSATTATGDYTKTGNTVRATFSINNIDTTGLTAGNVLHFSLPFQHAATYESTGACAFGLVTFGAGYTILNSFITANAGRGFFLASGNNIAFGNAPVSWFNDDAVDLRVTITYKAA